VPSCKDSDEDIQFNSDVATGGNMKYPHICSICGLPGARLRDARLEGGYMVNVYICDAHDYEPWSQWRKDVEDAQVHC
jgi:hypothetical protein